MSIVEPMRVLFVLNSLNAGGAEKQVLSLLQHMDTSRFKLGLAYLRRHEQLLAQLPSKLELVRCCDSRRYVDLTAVKRLADMIDEFQPSIVVCTNSWSLLNVTLSRVWARHAHRTIEVFHTTALHNVKQRLQMQLYRRLFEQCDSLVYVCENQRRYWNQQGIHARCERVIHNGIDVDYFVSDAHSRSDVRRRLGFSDTDYVIGLCANLRPEKAHGDLLQVISRLRSSGIVAKGLLIGDGSQRAKIEEQMRQLGLNEHVAITGFVTDVRPYITACDVMTLMSHSIETFSIAALESMSLGKPMVMTNVGGADEQIDPGVNGFLFAPGDLETAAVHLNGLVDAKRRAQMGQTAAQLVRQRFSLDRMVRAYEDHFVEVCNAGRIQRAA